MRPRRRSGRLSAAALALALLAAPALAVNPGEQLPDPAQEARAREISAELRCMVCQNQSIDDSDAPLAKDLRLLVRERIRAGDDDKQVLAFLTERYGEFVLLRPRLRGETLLLWGFAPAILVLGLAGYAIWAFRARRRTAAAQGLTEEERVRVEALLAREAGPGAKG
ncbi:cytochrome c-type biogenesis protein [Hansschlegelia beijingensis]|uniref:Cytochrome c-type biogenesis protein n=1 Tax=Hansschlegelia beijingensis TaxID=1133344 RepID=A0A7W6GEE5_9HYPH|nr:cytochrome c-type biogenesis protein [Hansschlegelia beijingensis]MBB3971958.1 cytochrome c-type biogenesis protein CcmH [Hansschlegelia beijingensis]